MIQMNSNVAINTSQLLRHFTRVRVSWFAFASNR